MEKSTLPALVLAVGGVLQAAVLFYAKRHRRRGRETPNTAANGQGPANPQDRR